MNPLLVIRVTDAAGRSFELSSNPASEEAARMIASRVAALLAHIGYPLAWHSASVIEATTRRLIFLARVSRRTSEVQERSVSQ